MAIYIGEADSTLDDKNRLTIPKKFRQKFPKEVGESGEVVVEVLLMPGYGNCNFIIMDSDNGLDLAKKISLEGGIGIGKGAKRKTLLEFSENVEVDKQGRILIPQTFLDRRGVKSKEVKVTGSGSHLSVYVPEAWEKELSKGEIDSLWDEEAPATVE